MPSDTIVAIDLGRYKSVVCTYTRATRAHTFRTVDTTPEDLARVWSKHPGAVVVIANCPEGGEFYQSGNALGSFDGFFTGRDGNRAGLLYNMSGIQGAVAFGRRPGG